MATNTWLVLAVGNDRQHGGNAGYDDVPDTHYSWDSTVANHGQISLGVLLWFVMDLLGTIPNIQKTKSLLKQKLGQK